MPADLYQFDTERTRANRERLKQNRNLLLWYRSLYRLQFETVEPCSGQRILEVGSGTSPLKLFYPQVMTSDILELEYLDHRFDCHQIDEYDSIENESLDLITLTNVLHHLADPVAFLARAARKLKPGGKIFFLEPYFSTLSAPIYRWLHHEPVDFSISEPRLARVEGPLSTANIALPQLIFLSRSGWDEELARLYHYSTGSIRYFSALSYLATGGISHAFPIPHALYRGFLAVDLWLARRFPRSCASFFLMEMVKR